MVFSISAGMTAKVSSQQMDSVYPSISSIISPSSISSSDLIGAAGVGGMIISEIKEIPRRVPSPLQMARTSHLIQRTARMSYTSHFPSVGEQLRCMHVKGLVNGSQGMSSSSIGKKNRGYRNGKSSRRLEHGFDNGSNKRKRQAI